MTSPVLHLGETLRLDLAAFARSGLRVGIWASSGRGKSFGVGVLCEELLAAGIPVVAIDPEGEIHTLREHFRVLVLGGEHADLPLPAGDRAAELVLRRTLDDGLGLVLDLSDRATTRSQQEAALPYLERLWVLASERRAPVALVIEEAHLFAPQSGASLTSDILHRFAKQGRKRGIVLVTASQRTQAVSKELMSQLNFPAIGGFEIERDYDAVKAVVDGHSFDELKALPVGEFFFPAAGRFDRWRARKTTHAGDSPSWTGDATQARDVEAQLGTLVEELRAALEKDLGAEVLPDPTRALRGEIRRLQEQLDVAEEAKRAAEAETERLRIALQVAGVIKVVITNQVVMAATTPPQVPATTAPQPQQQPQPQKPAEAVVTRTAAPATPSLRDLSLTTQQLVECPGVRVLINEARRAARRRSTNAPKLVVYTAQLLGGGHALTPSELALRFGSRSQVMIMRAGHALDGLVSSGFATTRDGRYIVNDAFVVRAVRGG